MVNILKENLIGIIFFLSCSHCNNVKNQSKYEENILDCCIQNPEELIDFKIREGNVCVAAKDSTNIKAKVTAELVTEVFNNNKTGMRDYKSSMRLKALLTEMNVLFDFLEKFKIDDNNIVVMRTLKGLLDRKSSFAEFKRNYVKIHQGNYPKLIEFMN